MACLKRPWPVLFMCCVIVFNMMGMLFGMGAVFTDIMDTFQVSRATASLVQSVCFGFSYGIGVFTGHFQQWQGSRVTVITGSVLATVGCVIAFLATHIVQVIVGFGVIAGVGISFSYLTAQIVTGTMFYDMKSLAIASNSVFTALGTALYPPFLRYLIHHYSLRGTFLILAAIHCQMILCGAFIGLLAPRNLGTTADISEPSRKEAEEADEMDVVAAVDVAGDEESHRGNARTSGDGGEGLRCPEDESDRDEERENLVPSTVRSYRPVIVDDDSGALSCPEHRNKDGEEGNFRDLNHDHPENDPSLDICLDSHPGRQSDAHRRTGLLKEQLISLTSEKQEPNVENALPLLNNASFAGDKTRRDDSRFSKSGVFRRGSQKGRSLPDRTLDTFRRSPDCPFSRILKASCLDTEILRNIRFVLFGLFGPSSYLFFTQPMIFMTDMAKSNQMTVEDGSFFLTIIFIGNLTGRVLAGFLIRLFASRILCVYSASVAAGGIMCLFYVFVADYAHFVAVSFILGLSFGLVCGTHIMVFLEILGPGRFAIGTGYVATVAGFFFLLAGPYGGLIRDLTYSYVPVYYVATGHGLVAGSLLFFTALRFHHRS